MFPARLRAGGLGLGHHWVRSGDVWLLPAVQWFLPDGAQLPAGRPIPGTNTGRPILETGEAVSVAILT